MLVQSLRFADWQEVTVDRTVSEEDAQLVMSEVMRIASLTHGGYSSAKTTDADIVSKSITSWYYRANDVHHPNMDTDPDSLAADQPLDPPQRPLNSPAQHFPPPDSPAEPDSKGTQDSATTPVQ